MRRWRGVAAAAAAAAVVLTPVAATGQSHARPQVLSVWAWSQAYPEPLRLGSLSALQSYFDVVLPADTGSWDTTYRLQLATARPSTTRQVDVWVHTSHRTPPGRLVAQPSFGGVRWQAWVVRGGQATFALPYGTELDAAVIPARRWTYGTVYLLAMLRWLTSHGYLPAHAGITSAAFGFEFAPAPGGSAVFTVDKFTVTMRR